MSAPKSKFTIVMGIIADLILLNLAFLVCCIPVVTIGASYTALYSVMFKIQSGSEEPCLKLFFSSFKQNFKQGTALWLALLISGAVVGAGVWHFWNATGTAHYFFIIFAAILAIMVFVFDCCFAIAAAYSNTTKEILNSSLVISLSNIPMFILISLLNLVPAITYLLSPTVCLKLSFIWVIFWFSLTVLINSLLLKKIFITLQKGEELKKAKEKAK